MIHNLYNAALAIVIALNMFIGTVEYLAENLDAATFHVAIGGALSAIMAALK